MSGKPKTKKMVRENISPALQAGGDHDRLDYILETMQEAYFEADHNGRLTIVNPSLTQSLGYSFRKIQRTTLQDILTPRSFEQFEMFYNILVAENLSPQTFIAELICKNRQKKFMEFTLSVQRGNGGNVTGLRGLGCDITESERADRALHDNEELYRTIFENTATANIITAEDTTILLVNSNFEKLTGYSRKEIENKMSWTRFVVPEDLEEMKKRAMMRRLDPVGSAISAYEFSGVIRSGEIRHFFTRVALIPGTKNSVASFIDITDQKKAENDLRKSEERFREMARLLPETIFETDIQGFVTFFNEIALERFGYTEDDLKNGLNVLMFLSPKDHQRAKENLRKLILGEKIGLREYTAQRKDGSTFPALVHSTGIFREGSPEGIRGFLIDMTEKKTMENQLLRAQKMEAIGTLAGGIAHDFNNLLMGILGNLSLMTSDVAETHPFYERIRNVEEYVQRGSDLTRQLLGFARGGKYEVQATNLAKFSRRSAEMFGRAKKEISIRHQADHHLWHVDVDRGQMEQVLLNLFMNAWQAMPGGGKLDIILENIVFNESEAKAFHAHPGKYVKLTVRDTGIGMDEATKARIFEPFFSTKERDCGTGLGLASVYGIIKNHAGFIQVDSQQGTGTSFIIYLPASSQEEQEEAAGAKSARRGQETILFIDDEEMIVDVGSQMLEGLGYKVLTAYGGRKGAKIFEKNKNSIDLVILDLIMPDMNGKETFEALRRLKPSVNVLLSSGYSLDSQARDIMAEGCKGFIQKPFSAAELSAKIRNILEPGQHKTIH